MKINKIKYLYLSVLSCFLTVKITAQNNTKQVIKKYNIGFVNNNIKFHIGMASKKSVQTGFYSTYGDRVFFEEELTNIQVQKIELLTCEELLLLLKDNKTDWCINLILYHIYEEAAGWFYFENNRKEWIRFSKDNDIQFWTEKFSVYK